MTEVVVPPVVVPPVVVPPAPAWHAALPAEITGAAQRKGWDLTDPVKAFEAAATAYGGAEKLVGAPPEKVLRMPEASSDPAVIDAFWQRLGAPKEGKEIDFSGIKGAGDKPFDEKLAEVLRATAVTARAPKDVVLSVAAAVQKHLDGEASAAKTIHDAAVATDKTALDKSWGANREANLFIANQALEKLAVAAGMPIEKAKQAFDALSKVGGIGAASAMEMLRVVGVKMGEDKFIASGGPSGNNMPMTREAAIAEIGALKSDVQFRTRLLAGSVEDTRRWEALHKIGYGQQAA